MNFEYNVVYQTPTGLSFKTFINEYYDIVYNYDYNTNCYVPVYYLYKQVVPPYSQPSNENDKGLATIAGDIAQQQLQTLTNSLNIAEQQMYSQIEQEIKTDCCGLLKK